MKKTCVTTLSLGSLSLFRLFLVEKLQIPYVPGSINSHYFHIIGDGKLNPIVGVYIPIIRIPIKGGMTIPNIVTFDHGTYSEIKQYLCVSLPPYSKGRFPNGK